MRYRDGSLPGRDPDEGLYFFPDRFEWRELIFHALIIGPTVAIGVELAHWILDPLLRSAGAEAPTAWRPIGWAVSSCAGFGFSPLSRHG